MGVKLHVVGAEFDELVETMCEKWKELTSYSLGKVEDCAMFRKELTVLAVLTHQSKYPGVAIEGHDLIVFTDGWDVVPIKYSKGEFASEISKKYDTLVAKNDGLEPIFVGSETNCHPWQFAAFYENQTYDIRHSIGGPESTRGPMMVASQDVCRITQRIVRQQGGYHKNDRTHASLINAGSYIGTAASVTKLLQAMHTYGALAQDGEDQAPLYLAFLRSAFNHGYDTTWPGTADNKPRAEKGRVHSGGECVCLYCHVTCVWSSTTWAQ
jgi:hypothetical protein